MIRKLFFLRHFTRSLGINKLIFKLFYSNKKYEEYFDDLFSLKILPNYIVYVIGANVGYYSKIYSDIIGNGGKVYSFEPSSINFQKLIHNTHKNSNIFPLNFAIGETESNIFLSQGEDEIGANSRLSISASENGNWIKLRTLNSFTKELDFPNAIKIDVEGFEIDVLKGADLVLKNKSLRVIGIELHSEILNEKGIKFPEKVIENILTNNDFKYKWVDFSHLVAFR